MKKLFILLVLLLVVFLSLTGCGKKEEDKGFSLLVKESSWSGWSADYEPEEKEHQYDVILNKEYVVNQGSLGLVFTITEVNDDYVVIETTEPFSDEEKGINLNSKKKEFKVYLDKETKLITPTTDGGNIYYLTLKK